MPELDLIGVEWMLDEVADIVESVTHVSPSVFNEANRYLPESVTSIPGFIRYDVNPYMREIVDCFDINNPVREISVMKGVQITYTTLLESGILYFAAHVGTLPMMYVTADKELARARIENNIIPMFQQSGFGDIIRSSDEGNTRKTGKTKDHLQFEKGAYLIPFGANNADKMRAFSICVMLKDEIDAWPDYVGKDGDPDSLTDARTDGYTDRAKIFRGSTPLIKDTSKIYKNYLRGDQRKYMVLCRACNFPQFLRWESVDKKTGVIGGFTWETENDILITDSVRYLCQNCGHEHHEHDKEYLYSGDNGAHWLPTSTPVEKNVRSYHLPALYSPIGMRPWWKNVLDYLDCYDTKSKKVMDISKYQVFYNNILAEPFTIQGSKLEFSAVSAHRRMVYKFGEVPNKYAVDNSESHILLLTLQVDVHKSNLAVSVMGWTNKMRCYVIDYWRFEVEKDDDNCNELTSPVWDRLRELIDSKEYIADDGKKYRIAMTLVDAGYANDTVTTFCSEWAGGVYPILGRDRPGKNQTIKEFSKFTTQSGTVGYKIVVDHYKDRLSSVLRREYDDEKMEPQPIYHFNAPIDITDKQLKELTVETRRKETDANGNVAYKWHRPSGVKNELWDLLVYGSAAVEILAYTICIEHFELESIEWARFWEYVEVNELYYDAA